MSGIIDRQGEPYSLTTFGAIGFGGIPVITHPAMPRGVAWMTSGGAMRGGVVLVYGWEERFALAVNLALAPRLKAIREEAEEAWVAIWRDCAARWGIREEAP